MFSGNPLRSHCRLTTGNAEMHRVDLQSHNAEDIEYEDDSESQRRKEHGDWKGLEELGRRKSMGRKEKMGRGSLQVLETSSPNAFYRIHLLSTWQGK